MSEVATKQPAPVYLQIARHAIRGPFTASTRRAQLQCLAACSLFLVAYLNLITIKEIEIGGVKIVTSLRVVAGLSVVYAAYQLIRFLFEATLEYRLFKLEFEPLKDMARVAIEMERAELVAKFDALQVGLADFVAKIQANSAFVKERDDQVDKIRAEHRPRIESLRIRSEELRRVVDQPEDGAPAETFQANMRAYGDALSDWNSAEEELAEALKPIRHEPFPHPDMSEGSDLLHRSFWRPSMPDTERISAAIQSSHQRGLVVAWLDIVLPSGLFVVCLGFLFWGTVIPYLRGLAS
ncbi:hypothetical protein [Phenylobacterium sp.]|uniref:hypothetical protein n=1 Tax=Phenylobacterium sp. TaxID=1871053 RepID=UPI002CCECC70|nr:hypothetical protein [Phenylobacterium sp.]HLZ75110.1 hypothetical protein [Phenylobacterium sp.]